MATEEIPNSSRDTKNDGFKCDICLETFASKRSLSNHNRKRHTDTSLTCNIVCNPSIASNIASTVPKQIRTRETEQLEEKYYNPKHECPFCDWMTRSPGSLVLHCFETHPSIELFTASSKKKLKSKFRRDENHNKIQRKHAQVQYNLSSQVKCPLCDVFYVENRLKGHLMTAHQHHKRIFCTHCAAIVVNQEKLRVHLLQHSYGDTLFKCESCECVFISAHALATHGRLHTSQSPFSCSVCQKAFQSKTGAIAHFYSHLKIEMLRETMPQKADTGFAAPQVVTTLAMLRADKDMITPKKEKFSPIMMEDSEDFVTVWD